jgi:hypothetical protein
LQLRTSVQDADYNILHTVEAQAADQFWSATGGDPEIGVAPQLACWSIPSGVGRVRWNVVLESSDKGAFGRKSDTLTIPRNTPRSLQLSDLVAAREITDQTDGDRHGFKRGERLVIPRMSDTVSLATPLILYFEIYNLPIDIRSVTRYELTYELSYLKGSATGLKGLLADIWPGSRESVSYTYREGGRDQNTQRQLSLDIRDLRPGRYELVVTVDDLIMGGTASRSLQLVLLP